MQSSRTLASFNFPNRGRFMIKVLQPEEGWDIFWTLLVLCLLSLKVMKSFDIEICVLTFKFTSAHV